MVPKWYRGPKGDTLRIFPKESQSKELRTRATTMATIWLHTAAKAHNFSGKWYTEIPTSDRYKNDVEKKVEKMAKEEKESKKKFSIKNDECHGMTPMVKIGEEFDLDDVSNEEMTSQNIK